MSARAGGRARLQPSRKPAWEAGFSPGPPWLKPFEVPIYFAGLKPGASTEVEDISYVVINSPGGHLVNVDFLSSKAIPVILEIQKGDSPQFTR
jgi:hypothetical protein